jgi:hypothetical protein
MPWFTRQVMPKMWKNGSTANARVPGSTSVTARSCCRLATRLRWVRITPFGLPLVPEE